MSLVSAVDESLRMVTLHQTIISQEVSWQFFYLHHYSAVFSLTYLVARRTCGGSDDRSEPKKCACLSEYVCVCVCHLSRPFRAGLEVYVSVTWQPPFEKVATMGTL